MDDLLQSRRAAHGNDEVHRWRYQQAVRSPSESSSNDGSAMVYDTSGGSN